MSIRTHENVDLVRNIDSEIPVETKHCGDIEEEVPEGDPLLRLSTYQGAVMISFVSDNADQYPGFSISYQISDDDEPGSLFQDFTY